MNNKNTGSVPGNAASITLTHELGALPNDVGASKSKQINPNIPKTRKHK
jgi:hypothetical protein